MSKVQRKLKAQIILRMRTLYHTVVVLKNIKFYKEISSFINGIYSSSLLNNGIYSSDMNPAEITSLCVLPPQQEDRYFWRHFIVFDPS